MSQQVKTFFPAKVKVGTKETDWVCEMIQCPGDCGEYVLESDYAALAAENERLKQPWVKILTESETWNALSEVARLTAENDRLKKEKHEMTFQINIDDALAAENERLKAEVEWLRKADRLVCWNANTQTWETRFEAPK